MRCRIAVLVVTALTVAAGCSGDDGLTAAPPSSTTTTTSSTTTTAPAPAGANPWLGRRTLAIAHAGGENEAPHSTLFAFAKSATRGADVLDMDVQLSSDGIPVVIHNDTVDRTTNATGPVSSMTAAQLNALDAGYWFTKDCWACSDRPESDYVYRGVRTGAKPPPEGATADDFGIPTLEQVFQRWPDKPMDIEIKGTLPAAQPAVEAVAGLIKKYDRGERTVIASFEDDVIAAFHAVAPDVVTSTGLNAATQFFLSRTMPPSGSLILDLPPFYDLNGEHIQVISKDFVDAAHASGLAVWVWMDSGDEENATFFTTLVKDYGVDGINSAVPGVLMDTLDSLGVRWDGGWHPPS